MFRLFVAFNIVDNKTVQLQSSQNSILILVSPNGHIAELCDLVRWKNNVLNNKIATNIKQMLKNLKKSSNRKIYCNQFGRVIEVAICTQTLAIRAMSNSSRYFNKLLRLKEQNTYMIMQEIFPWYKHIYGLLNCPSVSLTAIHMRTIFVHSCIRHGR